MKSGAPDLDASCHRDVVSEAQKGNKQAIKDLYEVNAQRIHSVVHAVVGANHAEDIAADTWVRILTNLRSYRPERGDFPSWATAIARNQAIDHIRRQEKTAVPADPGRLPHRTARENTEHDALEKLATANAIAAVAALPPDQARAVLLCVIIGIDAPTAGRILQKRPGAVRTAQHRGLGNLRARVNTPH